MSIGGAEPLTPALEGHKVQKPSKEFDTFQSLINSTCSFFTKRQSQKGTIPPKYATVYRVLLPS